MAEELRTLWSNFVVSLDRDNGVTSAFSEFEKTAGSSSQKLVLLNVASPCLMRAESAKFVYNFINPETPD